MILKFVYICHAAIFVLFTGTSMSLNYNGPSPHSLVPAPFLVNFKFCTILSSQTSSEFVAPPRNQLWNIIENVVNNLSNQAF